MNKIGLTLSAVQKVQNSGNSVLSPPHSTPTAKEMSNGRASKCRTIISCVIVADRAFDSPPRLLLFILRLTHVPIHALLPSIWRLFVSGTVLGAPFNAN